MGKFSKILKKLTKNIHSVVPNKSNYQKNNNNGKF